MTDTRIDELLLIEYSSQEAMELIRNYDIWGADSIRCVPIRKLPLEIQMAVFQYWGIRYHVLRDVNCNISDLESILLPMYSNAAWEVSLTFGEGLRTSIRIIGGKLLLERDQQACVIFKKDLDSK